VNSCGDGILQAGEQCDDGNTNNDDGCTVKCKYETCGDGYVQTTGTGTGQVATNEGCDDGNLVNGDGCNGACQLESGWTFSSIGTTTGANWQQSGGNPSQLSCVNCSEFYGTADNGVMAYKMGSGDTEIIAKVADVTNTNWTKAGVMIRETLNNNSVYAGMFLDANGQVTALRRTTTGGGTTSTDIAGTRTSQWVRLVRAGNTFTFYYSDTGTSWTTALTMSITMATGVYAGVGFAETSTTSEYADFSNITFTP
jgi:cysteine-rich repeat protein